ncbi:MAG: hypothetical protein ACX98W_18160 [bacterium]
MDRKPDPDPESAASPWPDPLEKHRLGLCAVCRWRRDQPTRRGQTFHRCGRAEEDDRFLRYPPIPVTACAGHEPDTRR